MRRIRTMASMGAVVLIALFSSVLAHGQTITGNITGTIKDTQGAIVTAATVQATNVETGFTRTAQVNPESATYLIQYLPTGTYNIEVSAPSFKRTLQKNVAVPVDQTITVDVILTVGTDTQTITVTDAPPLVQTATVELSRTITSEEIQQLPILNRNALGVLALVPGVSSMSSTDSPNFSVGVPSMNVNVNGSIGGSTPMVAFYLDGGYNMTGIRNAGNPLPNPDALQEVHVETNNFGAQYGRFSGAVVSAVTRSGTNKFHGALNETNRNAAFDGNPWGSTTSQHYVRNNFNGGIGGPIIHDKSFFYFSYGGLRQVVGEWHHGTDPLPTANERLGDFTASTKPIYAPGTKTQIIGSNDSPNCGSPTPNCIPKALLDKVASALSTKYIPLPNNEFGGWDGYTPTKITQDEYLGKFDHELTDKDHLSVAFFYLHSYDDEDPGSSFKYTDLESRSRQINTIITDVHTFSPNIINQAVLNFAQVQGARINNPEGVGIEDFGSSFTTQGTKSLPALNVANHFSVGPTSAGPVSGTDFYGLRDVLNITKGKHNLAVGGELSLDKDMQVGNNNNYGTFTFNVSNSQTTGNELSDFYTGHVYTMGQDAPFHALMNTWFWGLFVQDNYRIHPRLTLNLGLRWDVALNPRESEDLNMTFKPGVQSTLMPTAPAGLLIPGDPGVGRGLGPDRYHHLSPRVGLAWDPFGDGKTAIRAGAGLFYGAVSTNVWNQPANATPFSIRQTFNCINSLTDIYGCATSFPNGNPFPVKFDPKAPFFPAQSNVETIPTDYQYPYVYQINGAVQRQLPLSTSVQVAYVGTLLHDMSAMHDHNAPVYAAGATTSSANIQSRRPYGQNNRLGRVLYLDHDIRGHYHALQITATRPMTRNIQIKGSYVWSHNWLSATPNSGASAKAQNQNAIWEEGGWADDDQPHAANISGIWHIDYYRGDNFLAKNVLNGWSISTNMTFVSGHPFWITSGKDYNLDGDSNDRPNMVPGVKVFLDPSRPRAEKMAAWFNKAAFTPNGPGLGIGPSGTDGNTPRNYVHNPGSRSVDMSLQRTFHFERGIAFTLRVDGSNPFNITNLGSAQGSLSNANFGKITSVNGQHIYQLGGRLTF